MWRRMTSMRASVIRASCNGNANQNWHFDRVGTYQGDPVFVIRATHRGHSPINGEYVDCLDVTNNQIGQPIQSWHCNGGIAQQWRQIPIISPVNGTVAYQYASMLDPTGDYVATFNNTDVYPHLVMARNTWFGPWPDPNVNYYQFFYQTYVEP